MSTKKVPYANLKPKNVDAEVWTIVVEAWENGLSDREASLFVSKKLGIYLKASEITQWRKDNPDVADLKEFLDQSMRMESKLTVNAAIKAGKVKSAEWYLERKAADEFSTKSAVAFEGAVVALTMDEKEQELKKLVEKFEDGE